MMRVMKTRNTAGGVNTNERRGGRREGASGMRVRCGGTEKRTREGEIIRFMMTQRKEKMRKGKGMNGGEGDDGC